MPQTQPKFKVEFKELAVLAIQRMARGAVVMILNDSTNADLDNVTYTSFGEVKETDWTSANYKRIMLAFLGTPSKVIIVKVDNSSGATFSDTLAKLNIYNNYTLFCHVFEHFQILEK